MRTRLVTGVIALLVSFIPAGAFAQGRPESTGEVTEIKLDETSKLKASSLEAQISAIMANFALLQRQAQDMQAEMNRLWEERKKLIEEAAKNAKVEVKDMTEWAFDKNGQRYVKVKRHP